MSSRGVSSGPSTSGPSRDYIRESAFCSDSIPLRLDYERVFLTHRAALAQAAPTITTHNTSVFGADGLRARLQRNRAVNPPRDARLLEVARANALLVERLTDISFKSRSATSASIIAQRGQRIQAAGSNDRIRAAERDRIAADNLGIARRLVHNRSHYAPEAFKAHIEQHEYQVKAKSRLRAIQMKTSTPGQYLNAGRAGSLPRASTADSHRNKVAETNAGDEYAGALRAYSHQQVALGYGMTALPPIPGTSDAELLGSEDTWLESHQSDLQRLKEQHTHAPKVRQSHGTNPREALHAPLSRHYHHADQARNEAQRAAQFRQAIQNCQQLSTIEDELVVPRTRLDPATGAYEVTWIELKNARPDETHLAQRRPVTEAPTQQPELSPTEQAAEQYARAMAQYEYQQQASAMYAAYLTHMSQQQAAAGMAHAAEAKEMDPADLQQQRPYVPQGPSSYPTTHPDGTAFAPPVWPFGGSILPSHLMPPEQEVDEVDDYDDANHSMPPSPAKSARKSPSKKTTPRGRGGRQAFKLRKAPQHDSYDQASVPSAKSARTPRAPESAPPAQVQRRQPRAPHSDSSTSPRSPRDQTNSSKSAAIPTIADALGSDSTPPAGRKPAKAKSAIAPPSPSARTPNSAEQPPSLTHVPSSERPLSGSPSSSESKQPLVHERAPVADKIDAFERAAQSEPQPASAEEESPLEPTSRYSDAHPFSIAHSSPSQANLHAPPTAAAAADVTTLPVAESNEAAPAAADDGARPTTASLNFNLPEDLAEEL